MAHTESNESDEHIAQSVQAGNTELFGILVDRYESKITRYANKFLYNYADRQDAVQDVFLKAYQNIQSFRTTQRFSPWIYRIAHNTFINRIRSQKREKISFLDIAEFFGLAHEDTDAKEHFIQKLDSDTVHTLLATLSVPYREVLVLFYFEEKSYEEIADILHIPVSTVGVRLARARTQFKKSHDQHIIN